MLNFPRPTPQPRSNAAPAICGSKNRFLVSHLARLAFPRKNCSEPPRKGSAATRRNSSRLEFGKIQSFQTYLRWKNIYTLRVYIFPCKYAHACARTREERFLERFRRPQPRKNSTFGKIPDFWKDFYFSKIWKDCRKDFGKIPLWNIPNLKIFPDFRAVFLAFPYPHPLIFFRIFV